ncbi:MAG: hypothetical protein AAF229_06850 [Pseudomonadota bacterium]
MRHPIRTLTLAAAAGLIAVGCATPIGTAPLPEVETAAESQPTTGTRVAGGNQARRVTVFKKEDIERSGATSVGELLKGTGRR